mgnify:CR=1 FL=1
MKDKMKKLTTILVCTATLMSSQTWASGFPVFDGAAAGNAIQQLLNWKTRLDNLKRGVLDSIEGAKTRINSSGSQMDEMFERRRKKCRRIYNQNQLSSTLCLQIVDLEKKKYDLIVKMDDDIRSDFNRVNGSIGKHGSLSEATTPIKGVEGFDAFNSTSGAGKAETAENNVQIQLQAIQNKYNQYKNQLEALDRIINEINLNRKQLTKDQMTGSNLNATLGKAGIAFKLTEATKRARGKANDEVDNRNKATGVNTQIRSRLR